MGRQCWTKPRKLKGSGILMTIQVIHLKSKISKPLLFSVAKDIGLDIGDGDPNLLDDMIQLTVVGLLTASTFVSILVVVKNCLLEKSQFLMS
jgi:hypothetical protein